MSQPVFAQFVQVPENCINKVSPCMVHTTGDHYNFKYSEQNIIIHKDAIVKITEEDSKSNIDVIDGRMSLMFGKTQDGKQFSINNVPVKSGWYMVNRSLNNLKILDIKTFVISEYILGNSHLSEPKVMKSEFIDKNEFVTFTKYYFFSVSEYKKFLAAQAKNWKTEFTKQNASQTKVLLRTIASEKKRAQLDAQRNAAELNETKKLKETFFYRTFER